MYQPYDVNERTLRWTRFQPLKLQLLPQPVVVIATWLYSPQIDQLPPYQEGL